MKHIKLIFLVILLTFISHSVGLPKTNIDAREYKYNHPPNSEIYAAIPVSIVYDGETEIVRKDKAVNLQENTELNAQPEKEEKVNNDKKSRLDAEEDQSTLKKVDNNTKSKYNDPSEEEPLPTTTERPQEVEEDKNIITNEKPLSEQIPEKTESDLYIPVAVVYDAETTTLPRRIIQGRNLNKVSGRSGRLRSKRRRQQKTTAADIETTSTSPINEVNQKNINRNSTVTAKEEVKPTRPSPEVRRRLVNRTRPVVTKEELKPTSPPEVNRRNIIKYSTSSKDEIKPTTPVADVNRRNIMKYSTTSAKEEVNPIATSYVKQSTLKPRREPNPVVPIIDSENYVYAHNGNFHYSYESGDGTKVLEKGILKSYDNENTGEAVSGSYSYTDKDGNDFSLSYTADENGYRPSGAHLPTPPPIPPAIARALKYLATKTTPEPVTEASFKSH